MTNISKEKLIELADRLEADQNFLTALLLGFIGVIICASLWGMIGYFTSSLDVVLAVFAGGIIGYVVRETGKGLYFQFSILAAVLSAFSVILGEMMAGAVEGALYYKVTPWEAFFYQSLQERWERYLWQLTFLDIGIIIAGMAFSTRFSLRKLSDLQKQALSEGRYVGGENNYPGNL